MLSTNTWNLENARPRKIDCLCGRGGHATNHPGNIQFRLLVNQYKDHYMELSRYGKLQVAVEVVRLWRSQNPPGRFLAMTNPKERENIKWHDIGDKEAIRKTSQCLRERIPANQKARTLPTVTKDAQDLVDKTKPTATRLDQMSAASGGSNTLALTSLATTVSGAIQDPAASDSQFSQWLQQLQQLQQQTQQSEQGTTSQDMAVSPRPGKVQPAAIISEASSPRSNQKQVYTISQPSSLSSSTTTTSSCTAQEPSPTLPLAPQSSLERQTSIRSDLGAWLRNLKQRSKEAQQQKEQQGITPSPEESLVDSSSSSSSNNNNNNNNNDNPMQQQQQQDDSSGVPSAATLTSGAFSDTGSINGSSDLGYDDEDDPYKPVNVFRRTTSNRPVMIKADPLDNLLRETNLTALNQTLESGFNDTNQENGLFFW